MQRFIKKNLTILQNVRLLLLICFIIVHVNDFNSFRSARVPLSIFTFGFNIVLSYYEDLENNSNYILSEEYKKDGIHSFFNPFSWEKEWKFHVMYFSILIKQRKIFKPFYIVGYFLILLPSRAWTNYILFHYKRMLMPVIFALSYLSRIFTILSFLKFTFSSIFFILLIGNAYVLRIKILCEQDDRFRRIAIDLCLNKNFQYFFLRDSLFD